MVETLKNLDELVALCKRRGFIFQSSDIYGGLASCYDYGPLGVELKRNVKNAWWKQVVQMRDDMVGLDCSILMHPMVWKASGHVDKFADLIAECKKCHTRTRVDHPSQPRRGFGTGGPERQDVSGLPDDGAIHRTDGIQADVRDPDGSEYRRCDEFVPAAGDGAGYFR